MSSSKIDAQQIVTPAQTDMTIDDQITLVPLDRIRFIPQDYRHREQSEITERSLQPLADDLVKNGQRDPILVYFRKARGEDGAETESYVAITGHRRSEAMRLNAKNNKPGFSASMPVRVRVVRGATEGELIALSVGDNEHRQALTKEAKVKAAFKLLDLKLDRQLIRVTLGYEPTSWSRLCTLHDLPWLWETVRKRQIPLSVAYELGTASVNMGAEKTERLKSDLAGILNEVQSRLDREFRDQEEKKPTVASRLEKHVMQRWVQSVKDGEPIKAVAAYRYPASLTKDKKGIYQVVIPTVNLAVTPDNVEKLRRIEKKLARIAKGLPALIAVMEAAAVDIDDEEDDEDDIYVAPSPSQAVAAVVRRTAISPEDPYHDDAKLTAEEGEEAWRNPADRDATIIEMRTSTDGLVVPREQPSSDEEGED